MQRALARNRSPAPMRRAKHISGRALIYGALVLWAFITLFPIYWTVTTSFKTAFDARPFNPLGRLSAGLAGMALARPVAGQDRRDLDGTRRIPAALHQQRHGVPRRLDPRGGDRLVGGVRPQPFQVQIRAVAERRHFVFLPLATDTTACRPRLAVPGSL